MSSQSVSDLGDFYRFVGEKINSGPILPTPEEVLDEWRDLHPDPLSEDDITAIQEALDEVDNGAQGISLEEFDREMRKRFKFPPAS
jgi:hypothetical protein